MNLLECVICNKNESVTPVRIQLLKNKTEDKLLEKTLCDNCYGLTLYKFYEFD